MPKIASLIIFGLFGIGLGQRRDADDQTQEEGRIEEQWERQIKERRVV